MPVPRLLVSVRNLPEAQTARLAGASIIDVKEPNHGSLGRAENGVMLEILASLQNLHGPHHKPVISAAWGEMSEPALPQLSQPLSNLSFVKLGLQGMREHRDWISRWQQAREHLFQSLPADQRQPDWIAVAYVDDQTAQSPPVEDVIAAACEFRCAGLLFDTWNKSSGSLLELVSVQKLENWISSLHSSKLLAVTAGKVQHQDISVLIDAGADVIGVRSAACRKADRQSVIDSTAIQTLLAEIQRASR